MGGFYRILLADGYLNKNTILVQTDDLKIHLIK